MVSKLFQPISAYSDFVLVLTGSLLFDIDAKDIEAALPYKLFIHIWNYCIWRVTGTNCKFMNLRNNYDIFIL